MRLHAEDKPVPLRRLHAPGQFVDRTPADTAGDSSANSTPGSVVTCLAPAAAA